MKRRVAARAAVAAATYLAITAVALAPAAHAATRDAARFADLVNHTMPVLSPASAQKAIVSVRVLNAKTHRPATGKVWFVDADGVQISDKVTLSRFGWATISRDPPPGTLPGRYGYRVRYGGSGRVAAATSEGAAKFRVNQPPRDTTLNGTFAADPDYVNQDVGDISEMPNWTQAVGNSWNQQTQDSINWVLKTIASFKPEAFLVDGDLVNGRWGNPENNTGVFGFPNGPADMLKNQAAFYYAADMAELQKAGLDGKLDPAVGDHELGDNWWNNNTAYAEWKRTHLFLFRDAFYDGVMLKANGTPRFPNHPVGTEWDKTAYATMINPQTLLVTVDEISRDDANKKQGVDVGVFGGQLAWLKQVLANARRQGVRWIIVQGHNPILPAAVFHSSGLHVADGRQSPLWQVMKKYRVNIYLAGEVHATSRRTADGITQIATGAPINTGKAAFLIVDEFDDRLNLQVHAWSVPNNAPGAPMWQGGCPASIIPGPDGVDGAGVPGCSFWSRNADGNKDYTGFAPKVTGSLTVYLDGRTGPGTGLLVPFTGVGTP